MIKTIITYIVCFPALLMPCKLRILYAELLGWILQFLYYIYYSIMKIIFNEIKNVEK